MSPSFVNQAKLLDGLDTFWYGPIQCWTALLCLTFTTANCSYGRNNVQVDLLNASTSNISPPTYLICVTHTLFMIIEDHKK